MYFAAKKLGRYHLADKPTTAIVREVPRMRRIPVMSSTSGTCQRELNGGPPQGCCFRNGAICPDVAAPVNTIAAPTIKIHAIVKNWPSVSVWGPVAARPGASV